MKRLVLFVMIFMGLKQVYSQGLKPIAQRINEIESTTGFSQQSGLLSLTNANLVAADIVSDAGILDFNSEKAIEMIQAHPENITLSIPYNASKTITLKLYRSNFLTPDFSVVTSSTDRSYDYKQGLHYQGIIENDNSSIAAISIFENEVMGMISSPSLGNIIVGAINGDKLSRHIIYSESNLHVSTGPNCGTNDIPGYYPPKDLQTPAMMANNCIRLYWEVNYDLYQNKGNVTNVTNYVTAIFNQSSVLYSNDGIPVSLSQVYVWNTTSPYTATSTSSLLSQFQSYRNSFNGDLGHLLGLKGGGGIAATIGGLCSSNIDYRQCYSGINTTYSNVPIFSWTVEVVTHEQGHLMGSRHTHACVWNGNNTAIDGCGPAAGYAYEGSCTGAPIPSGGGTIMSYCHLVSAGINFSNGFGTQPKNVILNRYNNATCLTSCTGTTCGIPTGMNTNSITTTNATITWTAVSGATSYNLQYRVVGSSSWTSTSSTAATYQFTNLAPGTNYEWQVQTVCSVGISAYTSSTNFTTIAIVTCGVPASPSVSLITSATSQLNWTAVSGSASYNVRYKKTSVTTWTTLNSIVNNTYALSGLSNCTPYEFQVQAVCASGTSNFTSSVAFSTTGCVLNYCSSRGTVTTYEYINRVALGSINNTSGDNGGYRDYTSLSTNLTGGSSYSIALYPGFHGTSYREYWTVYIDYNHNGSFAEANERVVTGNSFVAIGLAFTVPASALNGPTRMRVQMQYAMGTPNSCSTFVDGEVEDYTVNITGNAQMTEMTNSEPVNDNNIIIENSLSIYPNPVQDQFTIELEGRSEKCKVVVFNSIGKIQLSTTEQLIDGMNRIEIDASEFSNGIYFVSVETNGVSVQKKIMIVK